MCVRVPGAVLTEWLVHECWRLAVHARGHPSLCTASGGLKVARSLERERVIERERP